MPNSAAPANTQPGPTSVGSSRNPAVVPVSHRRRDIRAPTVANTVVPTSVLTASAVSTKPSRSGRDNSLKCSGNTRPCSQCHRQTYGEGDGADQETAAAQGSRADTDRARGGLQHDQRQRHRQDPVAKEAQEM
ncbi:hypothetical protein [Mycobacterium sp. DL99]|uniref:hypothetical protein n=1 Tax=Mycobacterium sp. DL99 TaxID=2528957 RepID=UPI00107FD5F4|nr:hypothetical protein [Mycobacterium sp. DL99]